MSSIILSSILTEFIGPLGQIVGSELQTILGEELSDAIFGLDAEKKVIHESKLQDLQVQTSAYGKVIPIIYGTVRIGGNIIWAQPLKEKYINKIDKITYSYYATLAIAICKGEIKKLNRIWANEKPLSFDAIDYTFYKGTEDQNPDSCISSIENKGYDKDNVPAYRGISYIVIKDFPVIEYNNRIPIFTFEVQSTLKSEEFSVNDNVENVNMIPGSGEFVYDTKIQKKISQQKINNSQYIQYGSANRINHNNYSDKSDAVLSLDQLKEDLPNVKWISIVVNWFVDQLRVEDCKIYPAVEFTLDSNVINDAWQVGDKNRGNARLISKDSKGNPRYGGTVSDTALIRYIKELHHRGYKVMLYPMLSLDTEDKEWRGRLKGSPESIRSFFYNQYNTFINHYSNISKQTKVEGFIIGSELVELTKIRDEEGNYPVILELVKLAKQVKYNLGKEVIVTYAADWSEYHSYNGWYYMDELWASEYIDVIGIDAYFPLTDGPEPPLGYSVEDVISGWNKGEGYDYYYSELQKVKYHDNKYAWKNIEKWWSESHINPDGSQTKWQPKMKKIWFTEYGFPSINGCTNQPNVFVDTSSIESKYPNYSNKEISFYSQKVAIEGTLRKWKNSPMIEKMFLWSWDARPFPFFPNLCKVWSDCNHWQSGHWVQGKISQLNISDILLDLFKKLGLKKNECDTQNVKGLLSGYVINDQQSVRSIIKMLQSCYFFDVIEHDAKLKCIQRGTEVIAEDVLTSNIIINNNSNQIKIVSSSLLNFTKKVNIIYFNRTINYLADVKRAEFSKKEGSIKILEIPIIMEEGQAQNIAEILLYSSWQERNVFNLKLPIKYSWLFPGMTIAIFNMNKKHIVKIFKIKLEGLSIQISGVEYDYSIYKLSFPAVQSLIVKEYAPNHVSKTIIKIIHLPYLKENNLSCILISEEKNWSGAELFISYDNKKYQLVVNTNRQSTYGNIIECIGENEWIVVLRSGTLKPMSLVIVGKGEKVEIIKVNNIEFIEKSKYKISNFIRAQLKTNKYDHISGDDLILFDESIISFEVEPTSKEFFLKAVTHGSVLFHTEPYVFSRNL